MTVAAASPIKIRSLTCPNCGGNVQLRAFAHSLNAVCLHCQSVLDTSTDEIRILQKFKEKMRVEPLIPLGMRGKLGGIVYEAIGFQVRTIYDDGQEWSWHEYLLFNPYQGFRYLIQYNGHWSDVLPLHGLPTFTQSSGRKAVVFGGQTYKLFSSSTAKTTFVIGEFPWQVRVGEEVQGEDYVAPPLMLSAEITKDEITWSQGTYMTGQQVWQAFSLKGAPPPAVGIYLNQPSPHSGRPKAIWKTALWMLAAWLVVLCYLAVSGSREVLFQKTYHFRQNDPGEHSLVTDFFEVNNASNVSVRIKTDLNDDWAYFAMALIDEQTGHGYDFGREVSYYSGSDSDGSWTEGSRRDSLTIPRVPAGRYYLRIEPEMEASLTAATLGPGHNVSYEVTVQKAGATLWPLFLALPLLLIPPIVVSVRAATFETRRWAESDFGSGSGSSSSDEGDEDE